MSVVETPTKCQCTKPGYCSLMKREMYQERWEECRYKPHYFEMYLDESKKGKKRGKPLAPVYKEGVGTELSKLLAKMGFRYDDTCLCKSRAAEMNKNGIEWCKENRNLILDWLKEEANRRKIPFVRVAALLILNRAIRNAERGNLL